MTQIEAVVTIKLDLQGKELMRTKGDKVTIFNLSKPEFFVNQSVNYTV